MAGSSFSVEGLQRLYTRCEGPVGTQAVPREGQWVGLVHTGGLAPRGVIVAAGGPKEPDRL